MNQWSKTFYHFTCSLWVYEKHNSFSFIALLFMPRLSEHEQSGAIGMLKAGVRVFDVAWYQNCHPSTIQSLRDRYQAIGTVKDQRRSGQPRMATGVKRQLTSIVYRRYVHRRNPFQMATVSARRIVRFQGVICFWFFNKKYFITIT